MPPDAGKGGKGPIVSPRTKVHLLCFIALPVGFAGLVGILNSVRPSLDALALLYVLLIGSWAGAIRCPRCGKPIAKRWFRFLGDRYLLESVFVDRYCVHCAYDLDQREPDQR
jgi:hypothetical protein